MGGARTWYGPSRPTSGRIFSRREKSQCYLILSGAEVIEVMIVGAR